MPAATATRAGYRRWSRYHGNDRNCLFVKSLRDSASADKAAPEILREYAHDWLLAFYFFLLAALATTSFAEH